MLHITSFESLCGSLHQGFPGFAFLFHFNGPCHQYPRTFYLDIENLKTFIIKIGDFFWLYNQRKQKLLFFQNTWQSSVALKHNMAHCSNVYIYLQLMMFWILYTYSAMLHKPQKKEECGFLQKQKLHPVLIDKHLLNWLVGELILSTSW